MTNAAEFSGSAGRLTIPGFQVDQVLGALNQIEGLTRFGNGMGVAVASGHATWLRKYMADHVEAEPEADIRGDHADVWAEADRDVDRDNVAALIAEWR